MPPHLAKYHPVSSGIPLQPDPTATATAIPTPTSAPTSTPDLGSDLHPRRGSVQTLGVAATPCLVSCGRGRIAGLHQQALVETACLTNAECADSSCSPSRGAPSRP